MTSILQPALLREWSFIEVGGGCLHQFMEKVVLCCGGGGGEVYFNSWRRWC